MFTNRFVEIDSPVHEVVVRADHDRSVPAIARFVERPNCYLSVVVDPDSEGQFIPESEQSIPIILRVINEVGCLLDSKYPEMGAL